MKHAHFKKLPTRFLLSLGACCVLAACSSTSADHEMTAGKIDTAIQRASDKIQEKNANVPSMGAVEKMYNKDPKNPENAIKYAAALREADYANRASVILSPFANDAKAPAAAKTEFAAIQLSLGNSETAERFAKKATAQDPGDFKAFHYLGIALDAQGKHPEAEQAFRKGLDLWQGDPTPIMNNLALNLSTQGFLDEAIEILEKAKAVAPNRPEIERNLRIVKTLRQSENPTTPKPRKKPGASP